MTLVSLFGSLKRLCWKLESSLVSWWWKLCFDRMCFQKRVWCLKREIDILVLVEDISGERTEGEILWVRSKRVTIGDMLN